MDLVTRMQAADREATERAWAQYAALLERADAEATPAAEKEMRAAMRTLGKTPGDMQSDRAVLAQVRRLERTMAEGTGIDEQRWAAQQAITDHAAACRAAARERDLAHGRVVVAAGELEQRNIRAGEARHELAGLRERHGPLLGQLSVASGPLSVVSGEEAVARPVDVAAGAGARAEGAAV